MEVMSLRNLGFDPNLLETLHDLLDISDEQNQQSYQAPSRRYVREAKAMAATPADVKETKDAYVFVVDVPGLRPDMINVKIEDDNVLLVSGERKREKERDQGIKYLRMERRLGKYLKKFVLPDNADIERIHYYNIGYHRRTKNRQETPISVGNLAKIRHKTLQCRIGIATPLLPSLKGFSVALFA